LDTVCFQVFLDEFSKAYENSFNILLLDRGRFHTSKGLRIPCNVAFILLPPYSPELSPIERVWESIKDEIANELYTDIDSLKDRVASIICDCPDSKFSSLTSYSFFINAVNDVFL
jgi:transposase